MGRATRTRARLNQGAKEQNQIVMLQGEVARLTRELAEAKDAARPLDSEDSSTQANPYPADSSAD